MNRVQEYHFLYIGIRNNLELSVDISSSLSIFARDGNFEPRNVINVNELYKQCNNLGRVMRKPDFCLCENKCADQLRSNCEADQPLCFRYTDSTIPLLSKSKISSL